MATVHVVKECAIKDCHNHIALTSQSAHCHRHDCRALTKSRIQCKNPRKAGKFCYHHRDYTGKTVKTEAIPDIERPRSSPSLLSDSKPTAMVSYSSSAAVARPHGYDASRWQVAGGGGGGESRISFAAAGGLGFRPPAVDPDAQWKATLNNCFRGMKPLIRRLHASGPPGEALLSDIHNGIVGLNDSYPTFCVPATAPVHREAQRAIFYEEGCRPDQETGLILLRVIDEVAEGDVYEFNNSIRVEMLMHFLNRLLDDSDALPF